MKDFEKKTKVPSVKTPKRAKTPKPPKDCGCQVSVPQVNEVPKKKPRKKKVKANEDNESDKSWSERLFDLF